MNGLRRHDPERSRAAILDAAETLFLKLGFAGTSMSGIAKASGVTKSLIHHHFGSKEALWEEVKRTRFAVYYDRQLSLLRSLQPSPSLLETSMHAYFEFLLANPKFVRLQVWMSLSEHVEAGHMMEELRDVAVDRIRAAQDAGFLRSDLDARHIFVALLGLVQAWFTEGATWASPEGDPRDYLATAWNIFATGVLVDPPRVSPDR